MLPSMASMLDDGHLSLPDVWLNQSTILRHISTPLLRDDRVDMVKWLSNEKNIMIFSINRVLKDLKEQDEKERLPTQDTVAKLALEKELDKL
ncbi:hypothetical protein Tco_0636811 [Tanacetum coccineum]